MALESITYISDFNAANPDGATSQVAELDGHVRGIKSAIKASFPNVSGAVSASHTELSHVAGVTSAIQTQINALATVGWRFLKAVTASSSASVSFVNGSGGVVLDSTYDEYQIVLHAVKPASDAALWLRTSTNGGSSYDSGASDYEYVVTGRNSAGSNTTTDSSASAQIRLTGGSVESTREGLYGTITIARPFDAAYCNVRFDLHYYDATNGLAIQNGAGVRKTAADVDAIQLLFSTGNIASGYVYLYGRKGA